MAAVPSESIGEDLSFVSSFSSIEAEVMAQVVDGGIIA